MKINTCFLVQLCVCALVKLLYSATISILSSLQLKILSCCKFFPSLVLHQFLLRCKVLSCASAWFLSVVDHCLFSLTSHVAHSDTSSGSQRMASLNHAYWDRVSVANQEIYGPVIVQVSVSRPSFAGEGTHM